MKIEDIALTLIPKISARAIAHLTAVFGSAEAVYAASFEQLTQRGELCEAVAKAIVEGCGIAQARQIAEQCSRRNVEIVTAAAGEYPQRARFVEEHPHIIYMVGNHSLLHSSLLCAFTGDDHSATPYGDKMTVALVSQLAEKAPEAIVVADMDNILGRVAISCALRYSLRCVGVVSAPLWSLEMGNGGSLEKDILMRGGALISQAVVEDGDRMPHYNLVAAVADGVVAVEGHKVPAVAQCADGMHRTLMAVPGRVTDMLSRGTNKMIATNMAQMIASGSQIVTYLEFGEC